jgi:hypothetical protein
MISNNCKYSDIDPLPYCRWFAERRVSLYKNPHYQQHVNGIFMVEYCFNSYTEYRN